ALASRSGSSLSPRFPRPLRGLELAFVRRRAWNARQRRHVEPSNHASPAEVAMAPASPATAQPVTGEENDQMIRGALAARGTRYRWGGASRGGFDCSGLMRYLFAQHAGVQLPHSASAQARFGQKVPP